jgi:hypothetical protein
MSTLSLRQNKYEDILKIFPEGEYLGIINKRGRIQDEVFTSQINLSTEKKEMFMMGVKLQNSMQSDFDDEFGTIHYTITERENARFVSMPIHTGILLAKLDKSTDPFVFVNKITGIIDLSKVLLESSGVCQ